MTLDGTPKKASYKSPARASSKVPVQYGNNMRITVAANQGGRKYMEDRVQIETFRDENGSILFTYLGVYDGHGGYEASEYVRQHLMNNIINHEDFDSTDDDEVLEVIRQGFLTTHHEMWKVVDTWPRTASGYSSTAGTTASVAIIRNGKVYTGHVGDSAVILGKKTQTTSHQLVPERLTIDHKPESDDEHARIRLAGGQVMVKGGVNRVVWTRPLRGHHGPVRRSTPTENIPFLAVARSLGDLWSYCESTKEFIVSPDPDLAVRELTESDVCLVLASDGLTNVLAPMQVTMIVDEEDQISLRDSEDGEQDGLHRAKQTNHARALLATAMRNWRTFRADNISAIAVIFDPPFSELKDDELCVEEVLGSQHSIDEMFCLDPECMIRVAPETTQKLATYRTPLVYAGSLDANFCSVDYRGPGFITHEEEEELEARFVTREINEPSPLKAECVTPLKNVDDELVKPSERSPAASNHVGVIMRTPDKKGNASPSHHSSRSAKRATPMRTAEMDVLRQSAKKVRESLRNGDSSGTEEVTSVTKEAKEITESDEEDSTNLALDDEEPLTSGASSRTPQPKPISQFSPITKRVTRSCRANISQSSEVRRPVAVAVRQRPSASTSATSTATPTSRGPKVTTSTVLKISVEERETESLGVMTRSRDRRTTLVMNMDSPTPTLPTPSSCASYQTPTSRLLLSEKGSRKRPRQNVGCSSSKTGVTPFIDRMRLDNEVHSEGAENPRVRSAPTTPQKMCDTVSHMGSKWSLSKLDDIRDNISEDEPPSKIRRIYGFMRRLVGLGGSKQ